MKRGNAKKGIKNSERNSSCLSATTWLLAFPEFLFRLTLSPEFTAYFRVLLNMIMHNLSRSIERIMVLHAFFTFLSAIAGNESDPAAPPAFSRSYLFFRG